jgi:SAM-dependent methyltransferase
LDIRDNFRDAIRSRLDKSAKGLEFGPSFNPIARKADGFNVVVVDHASQEELRQKYQGQPVELDRIEVVDVVWRGQDLREELEQRTFDYIIASHVIEHVPCLVSFLRLCQDLLNEEGKLFLLVPDKRYCFDVFRPLTSLGLVLDAWFEKRTRPSPSQVFDQIAYSGTCLGSPNWSADTPRSYASNGDTAAAFDAYMAARSDDAYRDVHCWTFVPSSFRLIVSELKVLGLTALGEVESSGTKGCEFYICLSKSKGLKSSSDKLALLTSQLDELAHCRQGNGISGVGVFLWVKAVMRAYLARFPKLKLLLKRLARRVGE